MSWIKKGVWVVAVVLLYAGCDNIKTVPISSTQGTIESSQPAPKPQPPAEPPQNSQTEKDEDTETEKEKPSAPPPQPPTLPIPSPTENSCLLKSKMADTEAFLAELKITTPLCVAKELSSSETLKQLYSDSLFQRLLESMKQLATQELIAKINHLRLARYFSSPFHGYLTNSELRREFHGVLKQYADEFSRETLLKQSQDEWAVNLYESEIIDCILTNHFKAPVFMEFLTFLQGCATNGYRQEAAAIGILDVIKNAFVFSETPADNPFYEGHSADFMAWFGKLFLHDSRYVQQRAISTAASFAKAKPDVAEQVKQRLLARINQTPELLYWDRLQVIKILTKEFKATQDANGNPLNLAEEQKKCTTMLCPNVFKLDHVTYFTSWDEERVRKSHVQLMTLQKAFEDLTGLRNPLEGNKNTEVNIIIFDSHRAYQSYMSFFKDHSSLLDELGVYSEEDGAIYTYELDDIEKKFSPTPPASLDNVLKHEYAHYLTDRYLVPGILGEPGTAYDKHLLWFVEGIAEFLSGIGEDTNTPRWLNPRSRKVLLKILRMHLPELFLDTQSTIPVFYYFAWRFIQFLDAHHKEIFKELVASIADNTYYFKTETDNSLTATMEVDITALDKEFQQFLDGVHVKL